VQFWGLLSQGAGHEIIIYEINLENNEKPLAMAKVEASLPLLAKKGCDSLNNYLK
jgi:hypothetical protein